MARVWCVCVCVCDCVGWRWLWKVKTRQHETTAPLIYVLCLNLQVNQFWLEAVQEKGGESFCYSGWGQACWRWWVWMQGVFLSECNTNIGLMVCFSHRIESNQCVTEHWKTFIFSPFDVYVCVWRQQRQTATATHIGSFFYIFQLQH